VISEQKSTMGNDICGNLTENLRIHINAQTFKEVLKLESLYRDFKDPETNEPFLKTIIKLRLLLEALVAEFEGKLVERGRILFIQGPYANLERFKEDKEIEQGLKALFLETYFEDTPLDKILQKCNENFEKITPEALIFRIFYEFMVFSLNSFQIHQKKEKEEESEYVFKNIPVCVEKRNLIREIIQKLEIVELSEIDSTILSKLKKNLEDEIFDKSLNK
jgi:hypothetical protein